MAVTVERQRPEMWMVTQGGLPILRGLSRSKAERQAARLAEGHEKKRAGSRIPLRYYDIVRDREAEKRIDDLYTEFKGYRNGGNLTKTRSVFTGVTLEGG